MKVFAYRLAFIAPYILLGAYLLQGNHFTAIFIPNIIAQALCFLICVNIPAFLTKRMSYVDIGWPWGLVLIGVVTLIFGEGHLNQRLIIAIPYMVAGLRMGVGALWLWLSGHLKKELPRYEFQRKRWSKLGAKNLDLSLQYEATLQGVANMTFLALPAFIIGSDPSANIHPVTWLGLSAWLISITLENLADTQKLKFGVECRKQGLKNQNCRVGLWKYSRHPNYFFEWMVWNALIVMSLPVLLADKPINLILLISLLSVSVILFYVLNYYTGAIPAEYYSSKKRVGYSDYQKEVNRFFPFNRKKPRKIKVS